MKISCRNDHRISQAYQKVEGNRSMTDVLLARSLVKDIGGSGRVNEMIYAAYKRLAKMFPQGDDVHNRWTETRRRNGWYGRSTSVQHFQMRELYEAAQKAKAERELLQKARREHAEFVARTARLAALLEHQDETFHCDQIAALGQQSRGMGMPGNDGDR